MLSRQLELKTILPTAPGHITCSISDVYIHTLYAMEPTVVPTPSPTPVVLRGSCSCGEVTFSSGTLPHAITYCHCITCRKLSGNPYLIFGVFHNNALVWKGNVQVTASDLAFRGSCQSCHTPLFMKYHCRPDGTSVTLGLVEDDSVVGVMPRPKEHIFLSEKAPWILMPEHDRINKHEGFNEPFMRRLDEWSARGKPRRADVDWTDLDNCRWIFGGRPQFDDQQHKILAQL